VASAYVFSYTFQDTNGVKATADYYYVPTTPATVKVADVITDFLGLGSALDDASNARIVNSKITLPQGKDGTWKSAPVDENDVSDVIVFDWENTVTSKIWGSILPNLKNAELDHGRVDLTDADLAALTGYIDGGAAAGVFTNNNSQALGALADAFQADRKHRRQLRARSLADAAE